MPRRLDSLWGVFEGSDASWVFLDSAAVHWYLVCPARGGYPGTSHPSPQSRGHRHLSLLVGAVWMRSELEELLGTWLKVFGSPYCLALTNLQPPVLRLVDRGIAPDARLPGGGSPRRTGGPGSREHGTGRSRDGPPSGSGYPCRVVAPDRQRRNRPRPEKLALSRSLPSH